MPNQAVVLAGGLGTRLQPAVTGRPKVLANADGRPFLDYLLGYLAAQGLEEIILSTGHLAEQVSAFAGEGRRWGLRLRYCRESKPLGTAGALRLAAERYNLSTFFALNGDTLFAVDLKALWQKHFALKEVIPPVKATLALRAIQPDEAGARGCVRLANDGRIVSFDEKPVQCGDVAQDRRFSANGGVYLLERPALEGIETGQPASLERQVFPRLASQGRLAGMLVDAYFADIGTPQSLAAFEEDLKTKRLGISGLAS